MVLEDRRGQRETRRLRRYSRVDEDGSARFLLVFDFPREVAGVGLLATRSPDGVMDVSMYLPALRGDLIPAQRGGGESRFLGTDLSIRDILGEDLDAHRYVRRRSREVQGMPAHVVDVFDPDTDPLFALPMRRHFLRADNLFVVRTDHFDAGGEVIRRQTFHDLHSVDGELWRGNMMLMEDFRARHRTLVKIDQRIFSRDYVPPEVFTERWLRRNHPPADVLDPVQLPDLPRLRTEADGSVLRWIPSPDGFGVVRAQAGEAS